MLEKKRQIWQEAGKAARYKEECLESIIASLHSSHSADEIAEMSPQERA